MRIIIIVKLYLFFLVVLAFSQALHASEVTENVSLLYFDKGLVYYQSGEYDEAINFFSKVPDDRPEYVYALNNIGLCYKNMALLSDGSRELFEKARICYEKVLALKPDYYLAYKNLAVVYHKTDDLNRAETLFKKAIDLNEDYYDAILDLGALYIDLGRYDLAIAYSEKACSLSNNSYKSRYNLSLAYMYNGEYYLARKLLCEILQTHKNYKKANITLNYVLAKIGELQ